ncbi:MAG: hypothetical protein NW207_07110 [Cytophagales bacterium]|nr:hypothetical protein [Cytophagales bacterium]
MYVFQNQEYLFFKPTGKTDRPEILLNIADTNIKNVNIMEINDYEVIDTLVKVNDHYKGLIRFRDLENNAHPVILFNILYKNNTSKNYELKLYPYFETSVLYEYDRLDYDLFLDEEKIIEIPAQNVQNIRLDSDAKNNLDYDIRLSHGLNSLVVKLRPKSLAAKTVNINLKTFKPYMTNDGKISYDLPPFAIKYKVKTNRIEYINPDRHMIYFNSDFKSSAEIQFDYNRNFVIKKTYRIEDQPDDSGNLIGEVFGVSYVENNNKLLCKIRTFGQHQMHEGYLYIKEDGKTRFITNFDIVEKPSIQEISVMHNGEDWSGNLNVYPGERLEVKIKGKGLKDSHFQFDGANYTERDTSRLTDEVAFYVLEVPIDINKNRINIYMDKIITPYSIYVREYQQPKDFEYISINYGENSTPNTADKFIKPIFYNDVIRDINIMFDGNKIDKPGKLYGKQYFDIEVRLLNSRNDLIELQNINDIVVCPGEKSPRSTYYPTMDCAKLPINLNDILAHKTYNLDPFTQIFITFKHKENKYGKSGYTRKIKLILKRRIFFDVNVSFPAGLLMKKGRENGYSNLWGISIAAIAQFSFFDGERINRFKPYTIGAGFIALDAFNFSENSQNRDLGIVALGTITPVARNAKLTFPLYFGGGWLVKQAQWFVIFGPGFSIRF